jgi:hypothetical protein
MVGRSSIARAAIRLAAACVCAICAVWLTLGGPPRANVSAGPRHQVLQMVAPAAQHAPSPAKPCQHGGLAQAGTICSFAPPVAVGAPDQSIQRLWGLGAILNPAARGDSSAQCGVARLLRPPRIDA